MANKQTIKTRTGPKPERLKIKGNWVDAVGKALKKKRPESGWPTKSVKNKPT